MKLLFTILLLTPFFCFSQAGTLDETFGEHGKVYTDLEGECYSSVLQADGKILVGGITAISGSSRSIMIRYLPNGELDSSFGEAGMVIFPNFTLLSVRSIQVLENGNILAAGEVYPNMAVARLKPGGVVDSSFGENGISIVKVVGTYAYTRAYAMQVQAGGKIVLGGTLQISEELGNDMLLARLNATGSSDESFGSNGVVRNGAGYQINCLALQEDGKIVTGGQLWPLHAGDEDKFCISRYKTDGKIDPNFGTNGNVFTDITDDANDIPYSLVILSDSKIVAAGVAHFNIGNSAYMVTVKYNNDGTLDESFGENGIAKVIFEENSSEAKGLLIQPDNKLILTGTVFGFFTGEGDFALVRLKPNGSPDSTFGHNGRETTGISKYARSMTSVLQDGKIILAGQDGGLTYDYELARYNNDEVMPLHFTYFNAATTGNGDIALNWQTAQENNNDYFAIERSVNNNFNELTRINSKGNSSQAQTYSYTDNAPLQGTNFYRLKQVDKDGKFSYSQIVSATIENGLTVVLYPNPVKDVLNIKGLNAGMSYELSVMSAKGSLVAQTSINNISSYSWNLQSLSKGIYYLTIVSDNKKTSIKFVKE